MAPTTSGTEVLNILHLPNDPAFPHREERERSFLKQAREESIETRVWDGIHDPDNTIRAISRAHKRIVRHAADAGLPRVLVAEDDIRFTRPGAWRYFLDAIPSECDMFLGHVYYGEWDAEGRLHGPFASMTLYCVHERFYKYFLSVSEREHIDLVMNKAYRYDIRVCLPMVCGQMSGWSENSKRYIDWTPKEKDKPMLT